MKTEYDFSKAKRGAIVPQQGKTAITIYLDNDLLAILQERADAAGSGYQAMINQAVREYLDRTRQPVDEDTLRRILREELAAVR